MFATGFLQTGEGISAFSPRLAAGAATDFSFFNVIADIAFAEVVVKGNPGFVQYSEQLRLCCKYYVKAKNGNGLRVFTQPARTPGQSSGFGRQCLPWVRREVVPCESCS